MTMSAFAVEVWFGVSFAAANSENWALWEKAGQDCPEGPFSKTAIRESRIGNDANCMGIHPHCTSFNQPTVPSRALRMTTVTIAEPSRG